MSSPQAWRWKTRALLVGSWGRWNQRKPAKSSSRKDGAKVEGMGGGPAGPPGAPTREGLEGGPCEMRWGLPRGNMGRGAGVASTPPAGRGLGHRRAFLSPTGVSLAGREGGGSHWQPARPSGSSAYLTACSKCCQRLGVTVSLSGRPLCQGAPRTFPSSGLFLR